MKLKEMILEGYSGYLLKNPAPLFEKIPLRYPKKVAHHVTHKFPSDRDETPPLVQSAEIVAEYWDDGMGVQAVEVTLDGNSLRPDGKKYHITWSLDPSKGAKPVMSNKLLLEPSQKRNVDPPIAIDLEPKFFEN
jgi:hypothetical protein